MARGGRRGRHVIVFRVAPDAEPPTLDVLRILHDTMNPAPT